MERGDTLCCWPPAHAALRCYPATPLPQVIKEKDASVRSQDFEKAGQLRDREMELKAKIQAVIAGRACATAAGSLGVKADLVALLEPGATQAGAGTGHACSRAGGCSDVHGLGTDCVCLARVALWWRCTC